MLVTLARVNESMALVDEAMTAVAAGELTPRTMGRAYCNMMSTCERLGDYGRAAEWHAAADGWCEPHADSAYPGICRVHQAGILRLRGALTERSSRRGARPTSWRSSCPTLPARRTTSWAKSAGAWATWPQPDRCSARRMPGVGTPSPGLQPDGCANRRRGTRLPGGARPSGNHHPPHVSDQHRTGNRMRPKCTSPCYRVNQWQTALHPANGRPLCMNSFSPALRISFTHTRLLWHAGTASTTVGFIGGLI